MSLNYCMCIIDQHTHTPPLLPLRRNLSLPLYLHLFHIHPLVLSLASISPSLCFICVSVLSFPSLHLPLFYIHLSIEPPLRLLILMCLFFSPSLFSLFHFFFLSFTTDLFSALPTIYTSLWVFIPHHPFHSTFPPSVSISISFLSPSLSPARSLCSCSVFIYYCSVDNSLLCLQPYSHLSD